MNVSRPHCLKVDACAAKSPVKHCRSCTFKAIRNAPAFEEKRADAFRKRMREDPDFRAKHIAANLARVTKWREKPGARELLRRNGLANLEHAREPDAASRRNEANRRTWLAWCPEEYWPLNAELAEKRIPLDDRKRIVADEIARNDPVTVARRQIAEFDRRQRERHAREKAQAY